MEENKKEKPVVKISKETLLNLIEGIDVVDGYIRIQELPTDDEGKYQHDGYVFMHIPTRKFYMYWITRSGSYFSDYDFQYGEDKEGNVELSQVRIEPVTCFTWKKA